MYWTDHVGRKWKVPSAGQKLKFSIPCHRALRAFVYIRDRFACQECGASVAEAPSNYDGAQALATNRPMRSKFTRRTGIACFAHLALDHVVARVNGGSNHPDNLRALCECCNCAKSGLVDQRQRRAA